MISKASAGVLLLGLIFGGGAGPATASGIEPDPVFRPPPDDTSSPPFYYQFPAVPDGLNEIEARFGEPCSASASANSNVIYANRKLPDGSEVTYRPGYHKKLGAWATTGTSSNHDDIKYLLQARDIFWKIKGGVWGYFCRKIAGTDKWSTHAWGIAIDVNAAFERLGDPDCRSNTVTQDVVDVWREFRWRWGGDFTCSRFDAMHFQYAKGY